MKKIVTALLLAMLLISCKGGGETKEDASEGAMVKVGKEHAVYIAYDNWLVETDKKKYPTVLEGIVKQYEEMGVDLALFGLSEDNLSGTQVILEKSALDPVEYQAIIEQNISANAAFIGETAVMDINGKEAVIWEFEVKSVNFRYIEAIFLVGEYNVRVQLWTDKEGYEAMYPEFMELLNSVVIE